MSPWDYVGKRFIARGRFSFIDRDVKPGEEFVFTERYAEMGIQPDLWLTCRRAELVDAVVVAPPDPEPEPDPTPARRRGRRHDSAPESAAESTDGGEPPPDLDGSHTEADATIEPAPWAWESGGD